MAACKRITYSTLISTEQLLLFEGHLLMNNIHEKKYS